MNHPQRFLITGTSRMDERYPFLEPYEVDHLPQFDNGWHPTYLVIGESRETLEYLDCPKCFPHAGTVEDNRRAPGV